MSQHAFYAAMLRFVARKADHHDPRTARMLAELEALAAEVETRSAMTVAGESLEVAARALAGVAAFLQKEILPEAVAEGNEAGEKQIRWAVDQSMEAVNLLLRNVEARQPVEVRLPEAP